ncbi:hypothetical protein D3C76_1311500 [compost metagenome]
MSYYEIPLYRSKITAVLASSLMTIIAHHKKFIFSKLYGIDVTVLDSDICIRLTLGFSIYQQLTITDFNRISWNSNDTLHQVRLLINTLTRVF